VTLSSPERESLIVLYIYDTVHSIIRLSLSSTLPSVHFLHKHSDLSPYSIKNCFDRKKILEINDLRNKKDSLFVN
jgi:hypothetical protein